MSLKSLSVFVAAIAVIAPTVSAHGYVSNVNINGRDYPGFDPNFDPYEDHEPRIVRKIPDDGPVYDFWNDAMGCNQGGQTGEGSATATVNAGDNVRFTWDTWPVDHKGPVTCYMADCGGDCTWFNVNDAKWFKVEQEGYYGPDQYWATDKLVNEGNGWNCPVPASLANGNYLMRHEIVALHTSGQPQYYPACAQLKVENGGDGRPDGGDAWSTTDLYKDANWPDIWGGGDLSKFVIPGPSVASFISGGRADTGNNYAVVKTPSNDSDDSETCRSKRSTRHNGKRSKKDHAKRATSNY